MSAKNVPVQRLTEGSRPGLARHFLSLDREDVRLRFGVVIPAAAMAEYVERIDFDTDAVFGVYDEELALAAVAHVAFTGDMAELGVSVLPDHHRSRARHRAPRARGRARAQSFRDAAVHVLPRRERRDDAYRAQARNEDLRRYRRRPTRFSSLPPRIGIGAGEFVEQRRPVRLRAQVARHADQRAQCAGAPAGRLTPMDAPKPSRHRIVIVGGGAGGLPFRDLGSLVSLGELSAVGNLMGRLIGGSLLIQGLIARWMYASLYKMHQASILGYIGVALDTVGSFLRRRTAPRVKLH
jgi:hypothetical protein